MTTVKEFKEFLETLDNDTVVRVLLETQCGAVWTDANIPTSGKNETDAVLVVLVSNRLLKLGCRF